MVRFDRYGWEIFVIKENYLSAIREAVCYWFRDGLGDSSEMDLAKVADAKGRFILETSLPSPLFYELVRFMLPYCGHISEMYRTAAVCVCGELITFAIGDEELIYALMTALLSRTGMDEEPLTGEIVSW
ncbi:putative HEAT repeat-containing protein 7A [Trypanosoma theileri]|uniref:Putative HEAT repeat-containing protein 7A n=1 Tax=Trypanosoma theileri TaxID=67003 RepID=A0A1X0NJ21_9TRYP|nr:putative HEAT repeat-containing protein 7A [Trypanosoma theileri]ORC84463.1 putative HEAT repeat-containing protein 7A [Trypanosoma theileri]